MKPIRALGNRQTVQQAMAATGTNSPSQALRALKINNKKFVYLPHTGAKQRRKNQLRILKQLIIIPVNGVERRGFTGLQMLQSTEIGDFVKSNPEMFTSAVNMDAVLVVE